MKLSADNLTASRIAAIANACNDAALKIHMIAASVTLSHISPKQAEEEIRKVLDSVQIDPPPTSRYFTDDAGTWWKAEVGKKVQVVGVASRSWVDSIFASADDLESAANGIREISESELPA